MLGSAKVRVVMGGASCRFFGGYLGVSGLRPILEGGGLRHKRV